MDYKGLIKSPVGDIKLHGTDIGLTSVQIVPGSDTETKVYHFDPHLKEAVSQLEAYFSGDLKEFKLSIDWTGNSFFFCEVWRALQSIPYGKYRTYGQIAKFLRKPKSARAIGKANSRNPIAIIIPCHRVIGTNGKLTGYAYGNDVKRKLLQHENPAHFSNQGALFEDISLIKK